MTTPAWMPPQLPEVVPPEPEPERRWGPIVGLVVAAICAFGLGIAGWNYRYSISTGISTGGVSESLAAASASSPVPLVDSVVTELADGDWEAAQQRFEPSCAGEFTATELGRVFGPELAEYRGHKLKDPRRSDFEPGEIVLVFGEVDLGAASPNGLRVELNYLGENADPQWHLCRVSINEP